MKLHYSQASPFVRKVLVVAHEGGVASKLELLPSVVSPVTQNAGLASDNPLVKLPTLVLDDGTVLYDSPVVAEYLDALAGSRMFPANGPARWAALRRQAAADGLLDAALLIRYERNLRPPEQQSTAWIDGQYRKLRQTLDSFEAEAKQLGAVTIGEISIAISLGYLDFRFPDEGWRKSRPGLTAFYETFAARPSMRATVPPAA